jgi:predicted transcriptional regulator
MTLKVNEDIVKQCGMCAAVVYEAFSRLGGNLHIRVMKLRREMKVDYGESTIKKAISALVDAGYIERHGEAYDSRGYGYKVTK